MSPIRFDWDDEATWQGALAGIQAVYLVKPKTVDPAATVASFLKHCRGLERIVLLSEIAAEKQDASADELRVERVVEDGATAWTILRPNWFMQNFAVPAFFGDAIRVQHSVTLPTGGQSISFVDTRDIAAAAATVLVEDGHASQHYTITGPEALTVPEALALIAAVTGYDVTHIDPPLEDFLADSAAAGASANTIGYYRRIYSNIAKGFDSVVTPDVEKLTGRKARSFAAFASECRTAWSS